MAAQEVLLMNLFDSHWFGLRLAIDEPSQGPEKSHESDHDHHDHDDDQYLAPKYLNIRSQSEQLLESHSKFGSFLSSSASSASPSSVLASAAKLETIFSGKEARGTQEEALIISAATTTKKKKKKTKRRNKSMSELEFEELKGFMDLGFVFTEKECEDSDLVSMIPGLQKFCKRCNGTSCDDDDHHVSSRPYLSEAWERKNVEPARINLKIPESLGFNETHMKDQLKFWAHTVASTVR